MRRSWESRLKDRDSCFSSLPRARLFPQCTYGQCKTTAPAVPASYLPATGGRWHWRGRSGWRGWLNRTNSLYYTDKWLAKLRGDVAPSVSTRGNTVYYYSCVFINFTKMKWILLGYLSGPLTGDKNNNIIIIKGTYPPTSIIWLLCLFVSCWEEHPGAGSSPACYLASSWDQGETCSVWTPSPWADPP